MPDLVSPVPSLVRKRYNSAVWSEVSPGIRVMMEKRTQYTTSFKKRAIILSEDIGYSSVARRLGINESTIQGWRKNRDRIFRAVPTRKAFRGPKHGRHPEPEKKLIKVRQRTSWPGFAQVLPVNAEVVQLKARELARTAGLSRNAFKASRSWVQKLISPEDLHLPKAPSRMQGEVPSIPASRHCPAQEPKLPRRSGRECRRDSNFF